MGTSNKDPNEPKTIIATETCYKCRSIFCMKQNSTLWVNTEKVYSQHLHLSILGKVLQLLVMFLANELQEKG